MGQGSGIWLIGARGSVAATSMVGLAALQQGKTDTVGLVSELPGFATARLAAWSDFVVGGHDIRTTPLADSLQQLVDQQALPSELVARTRRVWSRWERNIRPGTLFNVGQAIEALADGRMRRRLESPGEAVARVQSDLKAFIRRHRLHQLTVINVASTEPTLVDQEVPKTWQSLGGTLSDGRRCPLGASSLYAIAALQMGCAYVNFTPSVGAALPAIDELARLNGGCYMGNDGKTGETLLKSVLAPMFAQRNLKVLSWVGHNIFGNLDGRILDDPTNKQTKIVSKDRLLGQILGYPPQTLVSIEYIESLGDWKTAWDHIHFQGFLGTPMKLQFTWQGCDSLLAAPLVLDLARFATLAQSCQVTGLLPWLACFFKSPIGVEQAEFARQFQMLVEGVGALSARA